MPVRQHTAGAHVLREGVRQPGPCEGGVRALVHVQGAGGAGRLRGQGGRVRRPAARLFRRAERRPERAARQTRGRRAAGQGRVPGRAGPHAGRRQAVVGRPVRRDRRTGDNQDAAGEQLQRQHLRRDGKRGGPSAAGHDPAPGPVRVRARGQPGRGRVEETAGGRRVQAAHRPKHRRQHGRRR